MSAVYAFKIFYKIPLCLSNHPPISLRYFNLMEKYLNEGKKGEITEIADLSKLNYKDSEMINGG